MTTPWKNNRQKNEEKLKIHTSSESRGFSSKCFCRHIERRYNKLHGFFSWKSNKLLQKYQTFLSTIKLLKTIAFLQNLHQTNVIQFWQPCLFWPKTRKISDEFPKNVAEVLERRVESRISFFSKKLVFLKTSPWTHVKQF